jgi:poly(A) polymerase
MTLRAAGHQAYLAGGCVRDLLAGREPSDYDVATSARPEEVLALFPGAVAVGAHFGVVRARGVEVATFRSDHSYRDGRHPEEVVFETDPRQDVLRRDFTINGLLLDPATNEVLDFVGGRADLRDRIIRAIGDPRRRFAEDHLRMLRAVRFAARFGYAIEPETLAAIRELAPSIHRVSAERVRDELTRILTEGRARRGMELLDETGLLAEVLPECRALQGVEQPPEYHPEGDVWTHTLLMLDQLDHPSAPLAWGALLHDIGKPATFRRAPDRIRFDGHVEAGLRIARGILTRLKFSRDDTDRILALVANHMRFLDAPRMKESTLKKFLRLDHFAEHLALHKADCLASHGGLETYEFVRAKLAALPPEQLKPAPLVTGRDLIALGLPPGPAFKRILTEAEDLQLEGRLRTRDEALAWLRAQPSGAAPVTGRPPRSAH